MRCTLHPEWPYPHQDVTYIPDALFPDTDFERRFFNCPGPGEEGDPVRESKPRPRLKLQWDEPDVWA